MPLRTSYLSVPEFRYHEFNVAYYLNNIKIVTVTCDLKKLFKDILKKKKKECYEMKPTQF